jgi:uncharacterized protein YdhG (YjbR/CyaY superfamily)
MATPQKAAGRTAVDGSNKGFSAEEKAAMQERVRELKSAARSRATREDGERDVLAKIAEMPPSDRAMAERIHALIATNAPLLAPKTWYGMPAYARDGKVVCFFKAAAKFDSRYATFGFDEAAHLDDGAMWPTSFALTELTRADEERIADLLKRAVR